MKLRALRSGCFLRATKYSEGTRLALSVHWHSAVQSSSDWIWIEVELPNSCSKAVKATVGRQNAIAVAPEWRATGIW
jgi:hypothetical protein